MSKENRMDHFKDLSLEKEVTPKQRIDKLIINARAAMAEFLVTQERIDDAVTALAWSIFEPSRARELAVMAVQDTGLGDVESKVIKNTRKTFGTLRDLLRVKTVGIIEDDFEKGITKYAKPVGIVAAISPSTNPAATPVNKAMMAIKGGSQGTCQFQIRRPLCAGTLRPNPCPKRAIREP